jgi:hypothetical protein
MNYVITLSVALLVAVTVFCHVAGMFDGGDRLGVNTVFIVIYYAVGWLLPSLVALVVWAIWFRGAP